MTETYYNMNTKDNSNMCRVCFATEGVRPMYADEIKWYQSIVSKPPTHTVGNLYVCVLCGHLICKYLRFASRCQDAQIALSQVLQQDSKLHYLPQPVPVHNLTKTDPKTYYLGPENNLDLDPIPLKTEDQYDLFLDSTFIDDGADIHSDDDVPLVMLSRNDDQMNKVKKKKKKKKRNGAATETAPSELTLDLDSEQHKSRDKRKKQPREGFSSRMVQETDEYTVIKLTKEQVLEELSTRSQSPRYLRALYRCERCVKGFNFEDVLRKHMLRHDPASGSFKCDLCGQYCPSAVSLRGHLKSHTTRYQCKVCGAVRLSRQHLLEHHGLAHTGQPAVYRCHHCCFTTHKRTVMQRHARGHSSVARVSCERCQRQFRSQESLRVHTARHDKSRSLQCPQCPRRFIYPSLLARHVHAVHVARDYYCVECDLRFKSQDNLRLHFKKAKRHRDSSTYTESPAHARRSLQSRVMPALACTACDKVFTRKSLLTAHARAHEPPAAHVQVPPHVQVQVPPT